MTELFLSILNMSISASWIVLAVILLRVLLKKAPKWIMVLLWGVVAVRLICPFSIESVLSLIPSAETVSPNIMTDRVPQINSGISAINNTINPVIGDTFAPRPEDSANPLQIWIPVIAVIWAVGVAALLSYMLISYLRLRGKLRTAVRVTDNVYECDAVASPFVLGILRPRIYMPFGVSEQNATYVIAHERAHIRRRDHLWKPFGFLLLALHWFNPLIWLGYVFLCRDIEFACDEKVVKALGVEARADYSEALLYCSVGRRMIAACPLAFGEVGVKARVKGVLNYRKPAFWIVLVAIIALVVTSVCLLTDPKGKALKDIEFTSIGVYLEDTVDVMVGDGTTFLAVESFDKETLNDLFALSVSKDPISENRSENRDQMHTLILHTDNDQQQFLLSWGEAAYEDVGIRICFDREFASVWIDDGVKPTFSHKVLEPKKAEAIYRVLRENTKDVPPSIIEPPMIDPPMIDPPVVYPSGDEIDSLRVKYPMYFDLPVEDGLTVVIWQMAADSYSCVLISGNITLRMQDYYVMASASVDSSANIFSVGDLLARPAASMEEMRLIVASYRSKIQKQDVRIIPVSMPHSSYAYEINDEYIKNVTALFWSYRLPFYDAIVCDIDGDGREEYCYLGLGRTSGLFTFTVTILEDGVKEYEDVFNTRGYDLSFVGVDGKVMVQGITQASMHEPSETHLFEISFENGHVVLTRVGDPAETLPYWG